MRHQFICGNWKMNPTTMAAAEALAKEVVRTTDHQVEVEVAIAPPAVFMQQLSKAVGGRRTLMLAQNSHWKDEGAFTGELSPAILDAVNCRGAIVGHSERRQYFGETDDRVHARAQLLNEHNMFVIICVGETLAEREAGKTLEVVRRQIDFSVPKVKLREPRMLVAYEPVWAIGTGKVATPEQAQEVHAAIRARLIENGNGDNVRILYGGSVKGDNAAEILRQPDVDGALVGGASLKADEFAKIVEAALAIGPK